MEDAPQPMAPTECKQIAGRWQRRDDKQTDGLLDLGETRLLHPQFVKQLQELFACVCGCHAPAH
jgi:hypothetical protein